MTELAEDVLRLVRSSLPDVLQEVSDVGGAARMLDKLDASVLPASSELNARLGVPKAL